jgi:hypothetical protein
MIGSQTDREKAAIIRKYMNIGKEIVIKVKTM